jgi:hypothetical protein
MELITAQIVNKALSGEPEHSCLQNLNTMEIYEFSQIKFTKDGQVTTEESLNDNDLSPFCIQRILNNGHKVQISINDDEVTLHF